MQILIRKNGTEPERRKKERNLAILRHYYGREIRDGSRIRVPVSKEIIRKLYQ